MLAWEEIPQVPIHGWRTTGCKCYGSDRKESYAVSQRQGIPQNHITQQTSHRRLLGGESQEVAASAWTKSNWELGRKSVFAELGRINAFQGGLGLNDLCGLNLGQAQGYLGYSSVRPLSPQGRGMKQTLWPSESFGGGTWPLEVLRWYMDDEHLVGSDLATPWFMCDGWRSLEARLIRGCLYTAWQGKLPLPPAQ